MTSSKRQAVKAAREYADSIVHSGHEMNRSCYLAHLAGQYSAQAQMDGRVEELEVQLIVAKNEMEQYASRLSSCGDGAFCSSVFQDLKDSRRKIREAKALSGAGKGEGHE